MWTPTLLVLDSKGKEQYRFEGFFPPEDFLAQQHLGLGRVAFAEGNYAAARKRYGAVVEHLPKSDAAPEALYWAGVAKYKQTGDGAALAETAEAFRSRYSDSSWAKKASVWRPAA